MIKFLVADDHFIVRAGISMLLQSEFLNPEIDECSDGHAVWKKLEEKKYDLIVLDILMPGLDSTGLLKNVMARRPNQKILILSVSPEEIYAKKFMRLGASGYINKSAGGAEIRRAITSIINDKLYLSPKMQDILTAETPGSKKENPFNQLSDRELEVLSHVLEGKTITEIAKLLSMHTSTAGTHKGRILRKLGVSNVVELNKVVQLFDAEHGLKLKMRKRL